MRTRKVNTNIHHHNFPITIGLKKALDLQFCKVAMMVHHIKIILFIEFFHLLLKSDKNLRNFPHSEAKYGVQNYSSATDRQSYSQPLCNVCHRKLHHTYA
jgi:hypothetical protein